jgi:cell division protein FtsB
MNAGNNREAARRTFSSGWILVAALGWSLWAWSALADRAGEASVQAEASRQAALERITAERDQLAAERDQLQAQIGNLQDAEKRVARAKDEVAHLEHLRVRLSEAVDRAQAQLGGQPDPAPQASSAAAPPPMPSLALSQQQIRAAQEALTELGYGRLEADGVIGPGTRAAVAAFERTRGLPVTGELTIATVEALEAAAGISLQ